MKRFILSFILVLTIITFGFTQDIKPNKDEAKKEASKDGIKDADKQALTDLIEKLKSDENNEEETLTKIVELYKRIGDMLIDELNELNKSDAEIVSKIQAKIHTYKKSTCEKYLGVFDKLNLADFKDKKFIVFNDGYWFRENYKIDNQDYERTYFKFVYGWLISKSEKNIRVLLPNMMIETFSLTREPPTDWKKHIYKQIENLPSPYQFMETDFTKFCKDFVEMKIKPRSFPLSNHNKDKKSKPQTCVYAYNGDLSPFTASYMYAYWALKLSLIDVSYQLIQFSYIAQSNDSSITVYPVTLVEEFSRNLRWQAITVANNGAPRSEILTIWENIQTLINYKHYGIPPEHSDFFTNFLNSEFLKEIPNMIKQLKTMIVEDKNWKEPTEEEFKKMTPTEQAEYWMYKLRDLNASQIGNPGRCNVFNRWGFNEKNEKNPAEELKKLGIDAIPLLIEHMDDTRPTRCVGYWRSYKIYSHYHLLYGDACQQIFEAISGIKIYERKSTSGTMMRDGKTTEAKEKAQAWWKEYKKKECEKLRSVFDLFPMPDLKGKKFVKFNSGEGKGQTDLEKNDKINFLYIVGWLIFENENEIKIFDSYLLEYKYQINKELPENWDQFKDSHPKDDPLPGCYKEIDFEKYCEDYIANYELLDYTVTCAIAYWALNLDLIDVSYKLFKTADEERQKEFQYRNLTIIDVVTLSFAVDIRYEAINESNKGAARTELLKKWEILSKLPNHRYSDEAAKMVEMLKKMIEEDKNWKEPTKEEFEKFTLAEQAKYWMYKLRDCDKEQFMNPGSCSVFEFFGEYDGDPVNPAEELKKLSYDAIPILIKHMDDPRPTRCVGFHRSFSPSSYYHLYIGDACEQIFEAISGYSIYRRQNTSGSMMRDGKDSEAKKQAQEWWDEFQKKGIKQFLIDEIVKGTESSILYARRFLKRYPDEAFDVIMKGFKAADDNFIIRRFIRILADIEGEPTIEFLLNQAKNATTIGIRVTAAIELHRLGKKEGYEIIFNEMKNYKQNEDESGVYTLIEFLCKSNDPKAIELLRNKFHELNKNRKMNVIEEIDDQLDYLECNIKKNLSIEEKKILKIELEALMVHALDFEDQFTFGGTRRGRRYSNPRLCDIAADMLQYRFKNKYEYDISGSLYTRDKQIVEMKNIWRKENNLPLLTEIKKKEIPKLSEDIVKGLIESIENAKDDSEIDAAIVEIEKHGLSALDPMQKFFKSLDNDNPVKDKLLSMLKRIAFIVNDVMYTKDSFIPDGELKKKIDDIVGKQLDGTVLVSIIKEYIKNVPENTYGILINANRDDDNMGFTVVISIQKSTEVMKGRWDISKTATLNNKHIYIGGGYTCGISMALTNEPYKEVSGAFTEAKKASIESAICFSLSAIKNKRD